MSWSYNWSPDCRYQFPWRKGLWGGGVNAMALYSAKALPFSKPHLPKLSNLQEFPNLSLAILISQKYPVAGFWVLLIVGGGDFGGC